MKLIRSALFSLLLVISSCAIAQSPAAPALPKGDAWQTPKWAENATIYEVNVRQFTPEGTFKAFEASLPRLRAMGVDILWLMPIYPIGVEGRKGTLGSYYAVKDYRDVNPEYGTINDFKHLMKTAHGLGFKVILDYVANHSSPDNKLTKEHPEYYKHDSLGHIIPPVADWSDVSAFDYQSKGLREYQIESMKFWLKECDVDGFRCDVAMMVPLDFWRECRVQLDKVKKVFMLAEAEGPEFHRNGFDMTYGWEYMNLCIKIAKGLQKPADLYAYFKTTKSKYKASDNIMYFTTDHDENSWNGTDYERLGKDAVPAFEVLSALVPGMPLVYSGQESSIDHRLDFFEKDTIEWGHYPQKDFYTRLLDLKTKNKALVIDSIYDTEFIPVLSSPATFAFIRQRAGNKVLTIVNLSGKPTDIKITNTNIAGDYKELFTSEKKSIKADLTLHLDAWAYKVYVK